jgi:hypothetical protein
VDQPSIQQLGGNVEPGNMTDSPNITALDTETIAAEVSKWVKRSALGSIIMLSALVTWILIIQLNRSKFGPKWFIIPLNDADRTGW